MTDDVNPFDEAVSCAAIYAAVYQACGPAGLKQLLDLMLAGVEDLGEVMIPSKEMLEQDVDELLAMDLPKLAAIVMRAAEKATPAHILFCPYDPQDACNYISWYRGRSALTPIFGGEACGKADP